MNDMRRHFAFLTRSIHKKVGYWVPLRRRLVATYLKKRFLAASRVAAVAADVDPPPLLFVAAAADAEPVGETGEPGCWSCELAPAETEFGL